MGTVVVPKVCLIWGSTKIPGPQHQLVPSREQPVRVVARNKAVGGGLTVGGQRTTTEVRRQPACGAFEHPQRPYKGAILVLGTEGPSDLPVVTGLGMVELGPRGWETPGVVQCPPYER